ncbi:LysR substrate-binding domain-containing protein [Nesterenkonia halophila]|uniref:LysR family transcriptional regulator n=1 Tax=Nesterenkonia halophila TaxID=302044 RepID=UPI001FEC63C9|nr:LysR family transcriptional regulator [Nesterenkonia halophila]
MDLRQMEYLLALAEERHFTRAAELVGISQSGFSAAIRGLEEELGTALFDRTTRRVVPTEAGAALLPHARRLLAEAADARDTVVTASRAVTGRLRLGSEQCLGVVDVVALLERFHRRHPNVEIEFTQTGSQDLLAMLRAEALDVAFVAGDRHLDPLPHRRLGEEQLVLLAAPEHPLVAGRGPLARRELADAEFVDFNDSWAIRALNESAFGDQGITRRVRCAVNDVHTLLDLVRRGLGVAVVPRHVAAKPQAAPLAARPLATDAPTWTVSAVSTSWDRVEAPATHLLELLDDAPACGTEAA